MNTSSTIRNSSSGRSSDPILPDYTIDRLVGEAVDVLRHGKPGILLIGSPKQAAATIAVTLQRLKAGFADRLVPVRLRAPGATPTLLRERVKQAHAGRADPSAWLLLVIEEADALSPDLLVELEMAADAAAELGGLQFLFAAGHPMAPDLAKRGLQALSASLATALQVPEAAPEPDAGIAYDAADRMRASTAARRETTRQTRIRPWILLALLAIVGLALLLAIGIGLQGRHPAPVAVPVAPMAAAPSDIPMAVPPAPVPVAPTSAMPVAPLATPAPPVAMPHGPAPVAPPLSEPVAPAPGPIAAPPAAASLTPPPAVPVAPPLATPSPPVAMTPAPSMSLAPQPVPFTPPSPGPATPPPAPAAAGPSASEPPAPMARPASSPPPLPAPQSSLVLIAEPGDTLQKLYARVYRGLNPPPFADVAAANPRTIRPGTRLVFPAPPGGWRSL